MDSETMDVDMEADSKAKEEQPSTSGSMSQTQDNQNIMAVAGTIPSVTISLHPLVIMNISEHWTRIRAQYDNPAIQVYGALIGKQKGRSIEVMNSFELKILDEDASMDADVQAKTPPSQVIIDREYYNKKEEQYKQVFSELDFIGWYTTGDNPTENEIKIHKQICEINECPIMLQLNPLCRTTDTLPVKLFESMIDIVQGEPTMLFVPLTYTLATEEAERIGVDHVARMSTNESGEKSVVAEHLTAQHSAIKMLHSRVKLVLQYIKAVENGELEPNQEILREAYSLSHRLPVVQDSSFHQEYYAQSNDVALITYLGALTKGCNELNHFVNKFNVLHDKQEGMGRRIRGLFF
uniref:COP9 signalosome complex subunit 6 n=1 Tax=Megaselia scalaris TaxID=36166 RepID=T1GDB7_MEGSC